MDNNIELIKPDLVIPNICQSGGKKLGDRLVNEDIIGIGNDYSFLMDGATGLGGPEDIDGLTVAEWYVHLAAKFLEQELPKKDKDIKQIVAEIIEDLTEKIRQYEQEHNMKFRSYEEPSSTLLIYRKIEKEGKDYIQVFALRRF